MELLWLERIRLKYRDVFIKETIALDEEGVKNEVLEGEKDKGKKALKKKEEKDEGEKAFKEVKEKEVITKVLKVPVKEMTLS